MPFKKKNPRAIDAETLRSLKEKGVESVVLDARLAFTEVEGRSRYARSMLGKSRVRPNMLPTQASGRWSITDPPLVNFPAHDEKNCERCKGVRLQLVEPHYLREIEGDKDWCPRNVRAVVVPDPGWYWVHYDLDGVEARLNAGISGDKKDLEAFDKKWDIHTITACAVFKMDLPPVMTKAIHESDDPLAVAWRERYSWGGSEDRRRHVSKTVRYALQYAIDERGALSSNELYKLKLKRDEILRFSRAYLLSKPEMTSKKRAVWDEALRTGVSYTFLGRRRRLFGLPKDRMKMAWNHRIQGSVTDIMNDNIIKTQAEFPESYFVLNSHDGATHAFELSATPEEQSVAAMKKIVMREWNVEGTRMVVPGSFEIIRADGTVHRV